MANGVQEEEISRGSEIDDHHVEVKDLGLGLTNVGLRLSFFFLLRVFNLTRSSLRTSVSFPTWQVQESPPFLLHAMMRG